MNSIAFVAAHDSEFKWAAQIAAEFEANGWNVDFYSPGQALKISEEQLHDCGLCLERVQCVAEEEIFASLVGRDAAVVCLPGPRTEAVLYRAREFFAREVRPVFVTGFVGINIKALYSAFLQRSSADILCVNSQNDYDVYTTICRALDINTAFLHLTGLGILPPGECSSPKEKIRRVVFADQVAIPSKRIERRIVYKRLCDLAVARPDLEIVIKPRHRPGESTSHPGKYPPETFFESFSAPDNVLFDYTPLSEQFSHTELLITVSSTAAFEALAYGVKVAIVGDLGISESYGNHIFLESGLIRTFDQIIQNDLGAPCQSWLQQYSLSLKPTQEIFNAVSAMVEKKRITREYTFSESSYFTSRILYYQNRQELRIPEKTYLQKRVDRYGFTLGIFYRFGELLLPPLIGRYLLKFLTRLHIYS